MAQMCPNTDTRAHWVLPGEAGWTSRGTNRPVSPTDPDNSLSVSIPEPSPLRVLLGTSLTIPCYFIDPMHPVTTAPATAPLTPRIKWSRISKEKEMVLLVATDGQVRVNGAYQDKVSLPNYPAIPSDATLEIQNLRSNDSGIYRCEVMHGIEDSEATVEVVVKGESPPFPQDPGSPAKRTKYCPPRVDPDRLAFKPQLLPPPVCTSVNWTWRGVTPSWLPSHGNGALPRSCDSVGRGSVPIVQTG